MKYRPLYIKSNYPDNYQDEYILQNLIINGKKNNLFLDNIIKPKYFTIIFYICDILIQICIVCSFCVYLIILKQISYNQLSNELIDQNKFILLINIYTIFGYFSRFSRKKYPNRNLKVIINDSIYYLFTLLQLFLSTLLIPIVTYFIPYKLLTIFLIFFIFLHLVTYDYVQHNSYMSTTSITFLTIILCGTMKSYINMFSFLNLSFMLFGLVPDFRRELRVLYL